MSYATIRSSFGHGSSRAKSHGKENKFLTTQRCSNVARRRHLRAGVRMVTSILNLLYMFCLALWLDPSLFAVRELNGKVYCDPWFTA